MQIQMQAFSKSGLSLRQRVVVDLRRYGYDALYVKESRKAARSKGWAKIKAKGIPGALNLEWDNDQHMLITRAITRGGNKPNELLGLFIQYLLLYHGRRIGSINIQLR